VSVALIFFISDLITHAQIKHVLTLSIKERHPGSVHSIDAVTMTISHLLLTLHVLQFTAQLEGLVDEVRAVGVVCCNFSKAFGTVSQNNLIDKLMTCRLDK